ncbi:MAG: T9SS type A sorting domain-containing protein [Bacteroidetes bacterium]|nr:T9SS type A sorting domain-containing protein [Bacteroidota bacterium]
MVKTIKYILLIAAYVLIKRNANAQIVTSLNCSPVNNTVISLSEGQGNTLYIVSGSQIFASNPFTGCTNIQFPDQNYVIRTSCFYNGALYVGGYSTLGMNDTTEIYKYSNGSWSIAGKLPNAYIRCMTVFNNELYIGGEFQSVNGITSTHIAKFNGTNWAAVGGGLGSLFEVRSLTVYNNNLYAAGSQISNDAFVYVLMSGNWYTSAIVSNNGAFTMIDAMTEFNGNLVIGGMFSSVNGTAATNIALLTGTNWSSLGSGLTGSQGRVSTLSMYHNKLYAGGGFTESGGTVLNNIAEWNGFNWSDVSGGLPDGTVLCLKPFLGSLICGGFFTIPPSGVNNYLAKVSDCTTQISTSGSTSFCTGNTKTLTASPGTAYQWYKNGSIISGATAGTYNASSAGSYVCFITNNCGLSVSNALVLTTNALPNANISAIGSTTFCAGGSVLLTVSLGVNNSYQWKKYSNNIAGANGHNYTATTAGKFKCEVTSPAGCSKSSSVIEVVVNPLPTATITAGGPTTFCAGGSVALNANTGTGLTYQWKKYSNNLVGAVNATYIATTAGKYKCTVTNTNGCSRASNAITVAVPCRIARPTTDNSEMQAVLYPNPSNGTFEIKLNNSIPEPFDISITDLSGRHVKSEMHLISDESIEISNLETGMYFVTIIGENERIVLKAIVNN